MGADTVSIELLAVWPLLLVTLMWLDRRHGDLPLFIVYSYVAAFAINYWFGAMVHSVPTDASIFAIDTPDGFALSTWGFVFLVSGAAAYPALRPNNSQQTHLASVSRKAASAGRATTVLVALGLCSWIIELSPLANVPSVGAAINGGKQLLIAAICLKCWLAWTHGKKGMLLLWLLLGFAFPLYTILFLGFLGFGISYLSSILIFVGTFYRPRWRVFAAGLLSIYAGLCVFIGYAENRQQIREAVWGGQPMEVRVDAVQKMISDIPLFDPSNLDHRRMIDLRLNQNWLVGASMQYVPAYQPYADGETLYMALIALVPRALWPDKSVTAGSGNLVTEYSGIGFAEGTSVGIGQVMEFYVNFGWPGVAIGFFILGLGLRFIDLRVSRSIRDHEWGYAGFWFAIGLAAIQPIGQLVEVSSSIAAAAVFGLVALKFSQEPARRQSTMPVSVPARPRSSPPVPGSSFSRGARLPDRTERKLL
jgi:hypothetical protein